MNYYQVDGEKVRRRGTITVFSADNLAAWSVRGFKALASAFRKCQYCMVTDEEMQVKVINNIGRYTETIIVDQLVHIKVLYSMNSSPYNRIQRRNYKEELWKFTILTVKA